MDFLYLNQESASCPRALASGELLSGDPFLERWRRHITTDEACIRHRQALFSDVLAMEGLSDFLFSLFEKLTEYAPLLWQKQAVGAEEPMHCLLYPMVYIELIGMIEEGLSPFMANVSSEPLKSLYASAKGDRKSREYAMVKKYYEQNAKALRSVHSVTVGINLDALYRPKEAGILSLNEEEFRSGDLLDRIIKLDFSKDDFHCLAPITVIDKGLGFRESQQVNYAFLKAMEKVLDHGISHVVRRTLRFVRERLTGYFEYMESLGFVVDGIKQIQTFRKKNIPLCFPKVSVDRSFRLSALYDSTLCIAKDKGDVVPNSVCLEGGKSCYLLTGPNSGGKTVFIRSLAAAQCYFQLGLPIPAKEGEMPVCDAIRMICADQSEKTTLGGRFEKECKALSALLGAHTPNSLVLIDEALTSTSPTEALPIAVGVIRKLCKIGGTVIFVTHYHELCEDPAMFAPCGEAIGYLHTEAKGEKRDYAVKLGRGARGSYAQSIAERYHLMAE